VSWMEVDESGDYFDEAEYFFTGDRERVFENMTSWLQALAGSFFDSSLEGAEKAVPLCMPMDPQFESEQPAITPLGPRDRQWLYETSKDGSRGRDFFAWWAPELDARYFLGRALVQMWSDVRWRPPLNDSERNLLQQVSKSLRIAHKLDPTLDFPWTECAEVLELSDGGGEERNWARSQAKSPAKVGYRRGNVTVLLPGGWRMRLPGSFSEFGSDEDDAVYALDPPREIWFTAYRFPEATPRGGFEAARQEILQSQPKLLQETKNYIAKAVIQEKVHDSGRRYFVLSSSNQCPTKRSICTIVFGQPEEREWAIETWRSLLPPAYSE
jgi:hypothetical protein